MNETIDEKPEGDPPPPLTVAEILAFGVPPSLRGWNPTQDTAGGYSFRATIGDIDYVATPHKWTGRTLTVNPAGIKPMGNLTAYSAMNGVTPLDTQTAGTMRTNDPNINRALVPKDEMSTSSSAPPMAPFVSDSSIHPGILVAVVLLVAFAIAVVVGGAGFMVGRRTYGNS